jgi:hypothetical protein
MRTNNGQGAGRRIFRVRFFILVGKPGAGYMQPYLRDIVTSRVGVPSIKSYFSIAGCCGIDQSTW